jgi:hypothetical protein
MDNTMPPVLCLTGVASHQLDLLRHPVLAMLVDPQGYSTGRSIVAEGADKIAAVPVLVMKMEQDLWDLGSCVAAVEAVPTVPHGVHHRAQSI